MISALMIIGGVIVLAALLMGIALVVVWSRNREISTVEVRPVVPQHDPAPQPIPLDIPNEAALHEQIQVLLAKDQKITAIKLAREHTNMGLKEAKDYVEALEAGNLPLGRVIPKSTIVQGVLDDLAMTQIRDLVAQKRKIDAIKLVRERTGMGLKEAKDYVEALEK